MTTFTLSVAVVDDDPIQVEILKGVAEAADIDRRLHFTALSTLKSLMANARGATYDIVFLDRRLPDSDDFSNALSTLSEAGLSSPLVLMSAHAGDASISSYGLKTYGPVDKLELVRPVCFKRLIEAIIPPLEQRHG